MYPLRGFFVVRENMEKTYMERALALAEQGFGFTGTNPLVGCVIVKKGAIIGEGYHEQFGGPHAEVNALAAAGIKAKGATMYVTLEPCSHHGKTPPCADAIVKAKISEVIVAMRDPNPYVAGRGLKLLRTHKIKVRTGLCAKQAQKMNPIFIRRFTAGVPFVSLKVAQTLDGRIADASGGSKWITGPVAREQVQLMRSYYDAVLVGVGTVLADNPRLDARVPAGRNPYRLVLDSSLRIPLKSHLIADNEEGKTVIITGKKVPPRKLATLQRKKIPVWQVSQGKDGLLKWSEIMARIEEAKIYGLLIEGGSAVFSSALAAGMVDTVHIFTAPKLLGDGLPAFKNTGITMKNILTLQDVTVKMYGADQLLSGAVEG